MKGLVPFGFRTRVGSEPAFIDAPELPLWPPGRFGRVGT